jgi:PPIC-type PPIASE domain/SurA-like N-terminal domain
VRRLRHAAAFALFVAFAPAAGGCAGGTSARSAVARIGGKPIAEGAVEHWARILGGGASGASGSQTKATRRAQALELLISSTWLIEEAAAQGISPSEAEVRRRLQGKRAEIAPGGEAELRAYLRATGETVADLAREARAELVAARLDRAIRVRAGTAGASEVAGYYARHRRLFLIPERRRIAYANKASRSAIERLRRRVEAGHSLISAAARKVGEGHLTVGDASASRRGPFERAIFAARPHVLTGPVYDGVDYDLFIVERVMPARRRTLVQVRAQLARQLTAARVRRTRAALTSAWMAEWTSRTSCSPGYVVQKCRQYHGSRPPENPFAAK